jgi:hypothetical protein
MPWAEWRDTSSRISVNSTRGSDCSPRSSPVRHPPLSIPFVSADNNTPWPAARCVTRTSVHARLECDGSAPAKMYGAFGRDRLAHDRRSPLGSVSPSTGTPPVIFKALCDHRTLTLPRVATCPRSLLQSRFSSCARDGQSRNVARPALSPSILEWSLDRIRTSGRVRTL